MKRYIFIALSAALILTGCYKPEIEELEAETEDLRNSEIAPLSKQIEGMKGSLDDLLTLSAEVRTAIGAVETGNKELHATIDGLDTQMDEVKQSLSTQMDESKDAALEYLGTIKSSLEGEVSDINSLLDELKAADDEINLKIDSLRTFADTTYAHKSWLEGTFATIRTQNAIIGDVALLKARVEKAINNAGELSAEMKNLIETDIAEACENLEESLAKAVKNLTTAYTNALDKAVSNLEDSFENALKDAINNVETSVMSWVNEKLNDYLTIAEASAKVATFNKVTGYVADGSSVQEEIEALDSEIKKAQEDITAAYTTAITAAILNSEGKLSKEIANSISELRNNTIKPIESKVTALEKEVEKLWNKMEELEGGIKTVEEQVAAIKKSIFVLDSLDVTLKDYIEEIQKELQAADSTNYAAIKVIIDELNERASGKSKSSLQSQIDALKEYLGNLPEGETSISEWIKTSKSNIEESFKLYYTVEAVDKIKKQLDSAITSHSGMLAEIETKLSTIIEDSKGTIDGWISTSLEPYYTGLEQEAILDALELKLKGLLSDGDKTLQGEIDDLKKDLEDAQEDLLKACKALLDKSISTMNGAVNEDLTSKLNAVADKISNLTTEVETIESKLATLKKNKEALVKDIKALQDEINTVFTYISGTGYETLADIVSDLRDEIAALPQAYGSLEKFTEIYNKVLGEDGKGGEGTYKYEIAKIQKLSEDLSSAESTLSTIKNYSDGDFEKDTLKELLDAVDSRLSALHTTLIDGSIRARLDSIDVLLYGVDGTSDEPAVSSLFGKLEVLSTSFLNLASKFRSIAYIPTFSDGAAPLTYDSAKGVFTTTLDFVVKPAEVATVLANSGSCGMKYISTPTKSTTFNEFQTKATFKVTDEEEGILTATVTVTKDEKSSFVDGASTALFVATSKYDFVSDFIPLYLSSDADEYYITPNEVTVQSINGSASITASVINRDTSEVAYYYSYYWKITPSASWITCSEVGSDGKITVKAATSQSLEKRIGTVKLQYFKEKTGKFTHSTTTEQISSDIILKVTQLGREPQTLNFATSSLTYSFNGYYIDDDGEISKWKNVRVGVKTSDNLRDWTVSNNGISWLTVEKIDSTYFDFASFSITEKNTTGSDRSGNAIFTTFDGSKYEFTVTQKARGKQTLSYNTVSDIPWSGLDITYARKITVSPSDFENDWTVKAASGSEWIMMEKHISDGYILVYADAIEWPLYNTGRSGKLLFTSAGPEPVQYEYNINQGARPALTFSSVNPSSIAFTSKGFYKDNGDGEPSGATEATITVTTNDGSSDWTLGTYPSWTTVTKDGSTVKVSVNQASEYMGAERTGAIVLTSYSGATANISVTQLEHVPQELTIGTIADFDYTAGSGSFTVASNDGSNGWTISYPSNSWMTATKDAANGRVNVSVTKNYPGEARDITITIKGEDDINTYYKTIRQSKRPAQTITGVSPSSLTISADGTKYLNGTSWEAISGKTLAVTTSDGESDWTVSGTASWFTSWSKDGTNVKATGNATANSAWSNGKKTGDVTVKSYDGASTKTCSLTQNRPLTVTQNKVVNNSENYRTNRESVSFTINSDTEWKTTSSSVGTTIKDLAQTNDIKSGTYYSSKTITLSISQGINQTNYIDITNKEGATKYILIKISNGSRLTKSKLTVTVVDSK